MELQNYIKELEKILKNLSVYNKMGLDTSSLNLFIKNLKTFEKIQNSRLSNSVTNMSFEDKLELIKAFLEDKEVFPRIKDIVAFANQELYLNFKDQKESRVLTIKRIIGRIKKNPELKEKIKSAVNNIRNKKVHSHNSYKSKKEIDNVESYTKWAEILKNI